MVVAVVPAVPVKVSVSNQSHPWTVFESGPDLGEKSLEDSFLASDRCPSFVVAPFAVKNPDEVSFFFPTYIYKCWRLFLVVNS